MLEHMTIHLATDHAGLSHKNAVRDHLKESGLDVVDHGAFEQDPEDDYPDYISLAAEAVSRDPENNCAIVFGGSGQGEAIDANKFANVNAVVFYGSFEDSLSPDVQNAIEKSIITGAKKSRDHNNANVLSLGARTMEVSTALKVIDAWLKEPFSGDQRHIRRLNKVRDHEKKLA